MNERQAVSPIESESAPLTDHAYDGIREYDNPLPAWWSWSFALSIVFSVFYFPYYHFGAEGRSVAEGYDKELGDNLRKQFEMFGELTADEPTILRFSKNASGVAAGRSVFKSNCAACHGSDGGGQIGPNLCDDFYKNVKSVEDIYRVISNGAAGNAMPAWKTRLQPTELILTAAYVASLRGSTPAKPKGADGSAIPPWPAPPPEEPKPALEKK